MKGTTIALVFVLLIILGGIGIYQGQRTTISVGGGQFMNAAGGLLLFLAVLHMVLWAVGVYGENTINRDRRGQ